MTYTGDRPPLVDEPPYDPAHDTPPDDWGDGPAAYAPSTRHRTTPGDRTPPQDITAEQSCLGAMLISTQAITDVTATIHSYDYYRPSHETIHDAITHLHAQGDPVDMVTVANELQHRGELQRIGGAPYLHTLCANVPIAANASYYARVVLEKSKLRGIVDAGVRLTQIGYEGNLNNAEHYIGDALDHLSDAAMRFSTTRTVHTTWSPVDLEPVLAGEHLDPPPTMLMRSDGVFLFYDGAVHTVSGESESGKTWLTLLAALQLLTDAQKVVFVDFEDRADRVIGRLLALGATLPQIRDHFAYIRPDRPLDDDGRAQLAPAITDARLVILDGVTEAMTMHGYDLNSNADSATFQGLLPRWIADHGPAVVLIDHVVKDKEKQDRFALGAQHKLAGIDGAAYIVKMLQPFSRGKRGLARVDVAKDRPGHVREHTHGKTIAEFTLDATRSDVVLIAHLNTPGAETGRAGDTFEPTVLMERISRYIQANPGMSKKSIEGAMNGKATTIRLALELLITRQYVGIKTGPRGAVQHFHHKPYYAEPDKDPTTDDGTLRAAGTHQEAS